MVDPLSPLRVLVPQAGLKRWLQVYLAEKLGVLANVAFTPPAEFAWELLRAARPELPKHSPFDVEYLRWRLYALLGESPDGKAMAPLRESVAADADPLRHYALSLQLARAFERMQGYRREKPVRCEHYANTGDKHRRSCYGACFRAWAASRVRRGFWPTFALGRNLSMGDAGGAGRQQQLLLRRTFARASAEAPVYARRPGLGLGARAAPGRAKLRSHPLPAAKRAGQQSRNVQVGVQRGPMQAEAAWGDLNPGEVARIGISEALREFSRKGHLYTGIQADDHPGAASIVARCDRVAMRAQRLHALPGLGVLVVSNRHGALSNCCKGSSAHRPAHPGSCPPRPT